jgi:tRNA(Ile)-lysidine synthase TilS/MesJ
VYVGEDEARQYAKQCELPIIGCCCPACGDLSLQRQRAKRLVMDLETEHPGVKVSMLKALANVATRHLLDTRLNPPAELRARVPQSTARPCAPAAGRAPAPDDDGVVADSAGGRRLRILQAEELSQPS